VEVSFIACIVLGRGDGTGDPPRRVHTPGADVFVSFALAMLPFLAPKPRLVWIALAL